MASPTVAAGILLGLADFAASRGADPDKLFEAAGLDPAIREDRDARIPYDTYKSLMRAAKAACNDPAFALHWGASVDMAEVSVVGLIMNASETMGDAFAQMQRYGRLVLETGHTGSRFEMSAKDGGRWLVDRLEDPNEFPEMIEVTFARLVCGPRRFLPVNHVLEVHVTYPEPAHSAAYEEVFQCPVRFNADWNALGLDPLTPTYRVALQPRYVFGVLTDHADALLARLDADQRVASQVEAALLPALHTGRVSADWVAGKLGMSRQTLYRRLKAEGRTFGEVLDDTRRRMALDYLGAKRVSVNETAYLVGFSDPAAFSRAFKRWTGKNPSSARSGLVRR